MNVSFLFSVAVIAPAANASSDVAVITVAESGGFMPPVWSSSRAPELVLYKDGRLLVRRQVSDEVSTMSYRVIPPSMVKSYTALFSKVIVEPKGGWGIPGVADVPSTKIDVVKSGKRVTSSIYALGFTFGLPKTSANARLNVTALIKKLSKLSGSGVYKPVKYEVWGGKSSLGTDAGIEVANPASVFCLSMFGSLQASDVESVFNCLLPDGRVVEEWAYYRSESAKMRVWPETVVEPKRDCVVVSAFVFNKLLVAKESSLWLMKSGRAMNLVFRPVLPGEVACKRVI